MFDAQDFHWVHSISLYSRFHYSADGRNLEAAIVERENSNRVKKKQGLLQVVQVQASPRKTQADAEAYAIVANTKGIAEALQIDAQALAEATRLAARADADAIRLKAAADQDVQDAFAREMELRRNEAERIAAYGNKTAFVPVGGAAGSGAADAVTLGFAAGIGSDMRREGAGALSSSSHSHSSLAVSRSGRQSNPRGGVGGAIHIDPTYGMIHQ